MATHSRNGATMVYSFRFGPRTPAWLDRGESRYARFLGRHLGRLGLLRHEYTEDDAA